MADTNLITHFTTFENFQKILNSKYFIPFYNKEEITTGLIGDPFIFIPMVCFCDSDTNYELHMKEFGEYGISLSKDWAIKTGLSPVMYFPKNSKIKRILENVFQNSINKFRNAQQGEGARILEEHQKLLSLSVYTKPYEGTSSKTNEERCFYFEREWRYIYNIPGIVKLVDAKSDVVSENDKIKNDCGSFLYFELSDVSHIITIKENKDKLEKYFKDSNLDQLMDRIHYNNSI